MTINLDFSLLTTQVKGEVLYDNMSLALYATDASLYQIIPLAIVIVKDENDVRKVVEFSRVNNCKLLARGGATSLAGQTVANAIIIDFSKYMTEMINFDQSESRIVVQPGVIHGELNAYLREYNLQFAPDPATSNRATIGGMIANNSAGTKSILYGKTSDYIVSLKVMLSDGTIHELEEKDELSYDIACQQGGLIGDVYTTLKKVVADNYDEINLRFPKIMRRVSGYALDAIIDNSGWNLSRLICGSEGTLAIILEATLQLVPLPKEKGICLVHFDNRLAAISAVEQIVDFGPSAVEMLDKNVMERSKDNLTTVSMYEDVVVDSPEAILICEFFGSSQIELKNKIEIFRNSIKDIPHVDAAPIYMDSNKMKSVWELRKKGLGLLMGIPGDKKPLPFIEDSSIPLNHLSTYIEKISSFCTSIDTEIVLYAHASVGVLHIRPYLDIRNQEDINKMKSISDYALGLVLKYGGSWSGEHGDGLVRSPKLAQFFGERIMDCFIQIKSSFDPSHMLNPHKKTDAVPMDQNLRYGTSYEVTKQDFVYQYEKEKSFESIVHQCSGISACRNTMTEAMCPSYRASLDEKDSPRGRANALRMVMSGQIEGMSLLSDELMDVLSLCLSCKACKTECPSNVDIAKLKGEVLQLRHDNGHTSPIQKMIANSSRMSKLFSGRLSPVVNYLQQHGFVKLAMERSLDLDSRRILPAYARHSLMSWYAQQPEIEIKSKREVVLFADTIINYHETNIGKAAYQLLKSCGYNVSIIEVGCCQRPKISNGFLKEAKDQGTIMVNKLLPYLENDIPILVCEPGCGSALLDDLPDLVKDRKVAQLMQSGIYFIDSFLLKQQKEGKLNGNFTYKSDHIVVHTHCHQATIDGPQNGTVQLCCQSGASVESENTGCCGMAGAFGYEKANYNTSMKVAERNILPKVKSMYKNSILIANGTSCRHQFTDVADVKARHWVEVVTYEK